ncbi:MAG: hypothetical protein QM811_03350 [Pirellulales bacterium]
MIKEPAGSKTEFQPGKYTALVSKMSGDMDHPKNDLPAMYGDANKTPFKVELSGPDTELPPFQMKTKP